ncbi:MAG: hypothetical protein E6J87_23910 [Deltaproteobacteria bacterium]|nr:MAG: hypothetical protein E6J87_23910 [Deltaproteobacteria bacterium]
MSRELCGEQRVALRARHDRIDRRRRDAAGAEELGDPARLARVERAELDLGHVVALGRRELELGAHRADEQRAHL